MPGMPLISIRTLREQVAGQLHPATTHRTPDVVLRGSVAGPGIDWAVRRDCPQCRTPRQRDRRAHGAGRKSRSHRAACRARRIRADLLWPDNRVAADVCRRPIAERATLRHQPIQSCGHPRSRRRARIVGADRIDCAGHSSELDLAVGGVASRIAPHPRDNAPASGARAYILAPHLRYPPSGQAFRRTLEGS